MRALLIAALVGGFFVFDARAQSQPLPCGERSKIVDTLSREFKEDPREMGVGNNGMIVELFLSEEGTFTILGTTTTGTSCLLGSGRHWGPSPKPTDRGI